MGSDKDLEKGLEAESTYHSNIEKAESNAVEQGAAWTPDIDHDEVEQMDDGHLDDLARQHVRPLGNSSIACVLTS
jgi:hypothetical protein